VEPPTPSVEADSTAAPTPAPINAAPAETLALSSLQPAAVAVAGRPAHAATPQIDLRGAGPADAALNARCLAGWLLAGADLNRPQMQATDLQRADLPCADLHKSDPSGANLQGADLYGSDWRAADHHGAYLATAMTDEQTLRPTDVFNRTAPGSSAERG